MNWLAHLLLSEPDPAFRLGNLLPDILPIGAWQALPEPLLRGARCHRQIDAYTDAHPLVRRSVQRLPAPWRRYGGVLCDVFYDHLLARSWARYCPQALAQFEEEIYQAIDALGHQLPELAQRRLAGMRAHRWLGRYSEIAGIGQTLTGIGRRLRRPQPLEQAVAVLLAQQADFAADFAAFFPQLVAHIGRDYALAPLYPAATLGLPAL